MTTADRGTPSAERTTTTPFFAEPLRDYVLQCLGQPVSLLQAGCLAPLRELGVGQLAEGGFDISVTAVDADDPLARKVLHDTGSAYDDVIVGDLRTVPLPQRKYDIVYCALCSSASSTLSWCSTSWSARSNRVACCCCGPPTATARRRCSTGCCRSWRAGDLVQAASGHAGPFPAVYEKSVCHQGIASYALMRGLVIAARREQLSLPRQPAKLSSSVRITCAAIARLSRGRFVAGHDELLYVIRKPEDRFARVV